MGSTAQPRYIGLREISERDILELYCTVKKDVKFQVIHPDMTEILLKRT